MGAGRFAQKRGGGRKGKRLFILEIFRATHRAGLGGGYIPRRRRPQPHPAHSERLHITGGRADHARHDTHARTLDTLHRLHSIPDRPRLDDRTGCGVLDCLCNVSETEQIRTLERHTKTGPKIITFSCMFVAFATLQIH